MTTTDAAEPVVAAARGTTRPVFISGLEGGTAEAALAAAPAGLLHGVPFAVKDNIDVAGLPTTAGLRSREACLAATSAVAVQKLVDAGAVPIGKTNMDQFATGLVGTRSPYGACHSVFSSAHVSGGSSSGSAVAVADGTVPFALATDTAGSGRVPAAFNGLVGVKPTRGLVSTRGVFPACPSLDCVTVMTRTVALARTVLEVISGYDARDPWSRRAPTPPPPGVARVMRTVGVPTGELDLEPAHRVGWLDAVQSLTDRVRLVPVGISPLLKAARLLYEGPFVAERLAAFGPTLLEALARGEDVDPAVGSIVLAAQELRADELFAAQHRMQALRRAAETRFAGVDAILLPTTPCHPTLAEVAADPIGVNSRLGTYTNMANLLDLCAVALPLTQRPDGLPFGAQLLAPAFADEPLLDLAALLLGEVEPDASGAASLGPGRELLAVCGAHLSGEPLNAVLVDGGGVLHRRARTASGYRLIHLPGGVPRPGLVADPDGTGHIDVELWDLPSALVERLAAHVASPLCIGTVALDDGNLVRGYTADPTAVGSAEDITAFGGWRAYVRAAAE